MARRAVTPMTIWTIPKAEIDGRMDPDRGVKSLAHRAYAPLPRAIPVRKATSMVVKL